MEARRPPVTQNRRRRLAEEIEEEGLGAMLDVDPGGDRPTADVDGLLDELDYAMRPPIHERLSASYGVFVDPVTAPATWTEDTALEVSARPTVDFGDAQVRRFADGFSSWAVRRGSGLDELVVFDRSAGSERDLVVLAAVAGGRIVQRHPTGIVRVVGEFGVVRWNAGTWAIERPVGSWIDDIPGCLHEGNRTVLGRILDFAVHDLGARRVGSMLIMHPTGVLQGGHERRLPTPPELRMERPEDLAPLRHALAQTDGAAVFDDSGTLSALGIRLVPSPEAEAAVAPLQGTRHTSALRYSHDDPDAVVVVVSEDGPVTVVRSGAVVGRSTVDARNP